MTLSRRWQDWTTVVLGVLLFVTPFVFGDTGQGLAAWTAYVGGVLLVLSGILNASLKDVRPTELIPVVLGVLLVLAPWVLGFTAVAAIAWSAWVAGILAILVAGSVMVSRTRSVRAA